MLDIMMLPVVIVAEGIVKGFEYEQQCTNPERFGKREEFRKHIERCADLAHSNIFLNQVVIKDCYEAAKKLPEDENQCMRDKFPHYENSCRIALVANGCYPAYPSDEYLPINRATGTRWEIFIQKPSADKKVALCDRLVDKEVYVCKYWPHWVSCRVFVDRNVTQSIDGMKYILLKGVCDVQSME